MIWAILSKIPKFYIGSNKRLLKLTLSIVSKQTLKISFSNVAIQGKVFEKSDVLSNFKNKDFVIKIIFLSKNFFRKIQITRVECK